jgi:hypothetical protein
LLLGVGGCTRRFYRHKADDQVDEILCEKDKYPDWKIDQYYVYPDPRARFADWTSPDRPPMPPDDPAAYDLSPRPQRPPSHAGIQYIEGTGYLDLMKQWDTENRAKIEKEQERLREERKGRSTARNTPEELTAEEREAEIEREIERELPPPVTTTRALNPTTPKTPECQRPFMLNLEQTAELGFLNSREFQAVREGLYLSALPVTTERFSFAAQPFLTETLVRERSGRLSIDGEENRWFAGTTAGVGKLFASGGLLLFNFANTTIYNLGKTRLAGATTSVSTINLDFIQPFLRGGGRAVTLEPLTQAERNLLYAIRDYYRFRQQYFVFFAAGQPTFIPGVQAGVQAISPATVNTPGPFNPLAIAPPTVTGNPATLQVLPGAGGRLVQGGAAVAPTPQGYLSTVGEKAQLVNFYKNIQSLRRFLRLFEVYLEGGIVNLVQVGQIEQTLLRSTETFITNNQTGYRISLDQLKQQLGLPMTIPIDVAYDPLMPMIRQINRYENLSGDYEGVNLESIGIGLRTAPAQTRAAYHRLLEQAPLFRGTRARERIAARWRFWEQVPRAAEGEIPSPIDRGLEALRAERRRLLDRQAALQGQPLPAAEARRLAALEFELYVGTFERDLREYEAEPWLKQKIASLRPLAQRLFFRFIHRDFLALAEEAFREHEDQIREEWPALPQACIEGTDLLAESDEKVLAAATRVALANRLDLMNNRAQLVDSWRKIAVTANALLGTFNVDYHMSATTPAGAAQPFNFPGSGVQHELIMNGQLPLVRIVERNNYRSALIGYQQQRRFLMNAEDGVLFEVRLDLRNLRAQARNYQAIQKRNIELAYRQVDQALQAFSQPQAPPGSVPLPGLVGPTAPPPIAGDPAALTQQLLNTQNSLVQAQNDLYSTWIGYLINRMIIYRDIGVMPIDSRGVWIDADSSCDCAAAPAASPTAPAAPADGRPGPERPEQLPAPRPLAAPAGPAAGEGN